MHALIDCARYMIDMGSARVCPPFCSWKPSSDTSLHPTQTYIRDINIHQRSQFCIWQQPTSDTNLHQTSAFIHIWHRPTCGTNLHLTSTYIWQHPTSDTHIHLMSRAEMVCKVVPACLATHQPTSYLQNCHELRSCTIIFTLGAWLASCDWVSAL